jgi:hypothetical protein
MTNGTTETKEDLMHKSFEEKLCDAIYQKRGESPEIHDVLRLEGQQ